MRVRVKTEFRDKHTGELHKTGDELDMSVERINEILKVGSLIELLAEQTEPLEQSSTDGEQEENEDTSEQEAEEQPKQKATRSRRRAVKKE